MKRYKAKLLFQIYIFYYEKYYLSKSSWHREGRKKMNPLDYCLYNRWTMFMPYELMLLHTCKKCL